MVVVLPAVDNLSFGNYFGFVWGILGKKAGKGGFKGGSGRGAICPMFSNCAYNSFKVMGKGGSCSSSC